MQLSDFVGKEPISKLVVLRWNLRPLTAFLIVLTVGIVDEFGFGFLLGYWHSTSDVLGVVDDIPTLVNSLIVHPGVWAFFVWFPLVAVRAFNEIHERGIIVERDRKRYADLLRGLSATATSRLFRLMVTGLAVGLTLSVAYVSAHKTPQNWGAHVGWHFWLVSLPRAFGALYVFSYSLWWSLMAVYGLSRIFGQLEIKVVPYHEDGAGGLKIIGELALGVSTLLLIVGVFLVSEVAALLFLG